METLVVLHIVVILRTGKEVWQGDGFWQLPEGRYDSKLFSDQVARAIQRAAEPLIDCNLPWKVKLEGESYTLRGKVASDMAKRLRGLAVDGAERVLWSPVKEQRFTLAEGANNG